LGFCWPAAPPTFLLQTDQEGDSCTLFWPGLAQDPQPPRHGQLGALRCSKRTPGLPGWRRRVNAMRLLVTSLDPGQYSHDIGGGGLHAVISSARATPEVVAGPGDVVPGDHAVEPTGTEILTCFRVVGGSTQLRPVVALQ